jgi:hypothetical protein
MDLISLPLPFPKKKKKKADLFRIDFIKLTGT